MKNNKILSLLFALSMLLFSSCDQSLDHTTKEEMKQIISKNYAQLSEGIQHKNSDLISSLYTADARFGPPGEDFTDGNKSVGTWFQGGIEYGLKDIKMESTGLNGNGTIWFESGKSTVSLLDQAADTVFIEHDKYVRVWQKQGDGSFKIALELWNADAEKIK